MAKQSEDKKEHASCSQKASPIQTHRARRTPGRLKPRTVAKSPHAVRAFEQRGASNPAQDRRKSGRYYDSRDTPRDTLRALSRHLAPTTEAWQPTPKAMKGDGKIQADINNSKKTKCQPLHSGPLGIDLMQCDIGNEEDANLHRPDLSFGLDDQSFEIGRRARPLQRSSFGISVDDRFADLLELRGVTRGEEDTIGDLSRGTEYFFEVEGGEGDGALEHDTINHTQSSVIPLSLIPDVDDNAPESGDTNKFNYFNESYFLQSANSETRSILTYSESPTLGVVYPKADSFSQNLRSKGSGKRKESKKLLSKHKIAYSPLSGKVIRSLASTVLGSNISNETLKVLSSVSSVFFDQISGDLEDFAHHAGRKTIEESDAYQLLKRQRFTKQHLTPFSLAHRNLSRELLNEIKIPLSKLSVIDGAETLVVAD